MISLYQNVSGLAAVGVPKVEPLLHQQRYLNVGRLMTLMAISSTEGQIPLYVQVILQILREMAREPTISPKFLDLCSFTLVHRFTSSDWLKVLKTHLAAASLETSTRTDSDVLERTLMQMINLNAGEALLFAPSAILDVENMVGQGGMTTLRLGKLGISYLKVRVRHRLTADGGRSISAI